MEDYLCQVMPFRISIRYIIAFIALNMIMGELHEQVHINTGYLICGCYGPRDFSVWQTCEHCSGSGLAFLATLAGPVFSIILMWLGAVWFSRSSNPGKRSFGFALLFANLPFARIFTALMGGGDEKVVLQSVLGDTVNAWVIKLLAVAVVLLLCLPPMLIVSRKLPVRHRWWIIAGFAIIPLIYGMFYHHMFLNWLLKKGIAAETVLLGTPDLILYHFALMLLLFVLFRKALIQKNTK